MIPDTLADAVQRLPTGWQATYAAEVSSTQDVARAAARGGAPSKSIFVADYQTAGRGRQGRSWIAQPGLALMLSLLLRQSSEPRPWRSTALASVALVEALREVAPELTDVAIKWPNDVLVNGKKVAGVLADSTWDGAEATVIVGIGVNVHASQAALAEIGAPAMSLRVASGRSIDRGALLLELLRRIDSWLARPEVELQHAWQARLWGRGQRVRVRDATLDEDVVILGATLDGALRIRLADGRELSTTTAEILP